MQSIIDPSVENNTSDFSDLSDYKATAMLNAIFEY